MKYTRYYIQLFCPECGNASNDAFVVLEECDDCVECSVCGHPCDASGIICSEYGEYGWCGAVG